MVGGEEPNEDLLRWILISVGGALLPFLILAIAMAREMYSSDAKRYGENHPETKKYLKYSTISRYIERESGENTN